MSLIDRYVHQVGINLPRRLRQDVEQELRSTLQDELESRAKREGQEINEDLEAALLLEFGPPREMAHSYTGAKRYVVGPNLYPTFVLTVKIVLSVLAALAVVGAGLGLLGSSELGTELIKSFFLRLAGFWNSATSAFGVIVLVFLLIERFGTPRPAQPKPWDPRTLPDPVDKDLVKKGALVAGAALATLGLVIFNFFPDRIGFFTTVGEGGTFIPVIGAGFKSYVPHLDLILLGTIGLNVALLRHGRWRPLTRSIDMLIGLLSALLFWRMLFGPPIVDLTTARLVSLGASEASAAGYQQLVKPILEMSLRFAFTAGLIGTLVGFAVQARRLFKSLGSSGRGPANSPP